MSNYGRRAEIRRLEMNPVIHTDTLDGEAKKSLHHKSWRKKVQYIVATRTKVFPRWCCNNNKKAHSRHSRHNAGQFGGPIWGPLKFIKKNWCLVIKILRISKWTYKQKSDYLIFFCSLFYLFIYCVIVGPGYYHFQISFFFLDCTNIFFDMFINYDPLNRN